MKNKTTVTATTILWVLVIFVLCTIPGDSIPDPHMNIPHLDKAVHFGMFFIMSVLLTLTLEQLTGWSLKKIYLPAILIVSGYGGVIEILQHFYFDRGGDVWDLLADVTGSIAGCLCYPFIKCLLHLKN